MFNRIWDSPRKEGYHFTEGMWLCLASLVPSLHPARNSLNVFFWLSDKLHHCCQSSLIGSPSLVPEGFKPHVVAIQLNYTSVCVWVPSGWKYSLPHKTPGYAFVVVPVFHMKRHLGTFFFLESTVKLNCLIQEWRKQQIMVLCKI